MTRLKFPSQLHQLLSFLSKTPAVAPSSNAVALASKAAAAANLLVLALLLSRFSSPSSTPLSAYLGKSKNPTRLEFLAKRWCPSRSSTLAASRFNRPLCSLARRTTL